MVCPLEVCSPVGDVRGRWSLGDHVCRCINYGGGGGGAHLPCELVPETVLFGGGLTSNLAFSVSVLFFFSVLCDVVMQPNLLSPEAR